MDRTAILLNLRDLRDLEVAKVCITKKRSEDWYGYQRQIDSLAEVNYIELKQEGGNELGWCILFALGTIAGAAMAIAGLCNLGDGGGGPFIIRTIVAIFRSPILALLGILAGIPLAFYSGALFIGSLSLSEDNAKAKESNIQAMQHNAKERERVVANQPRIATLQQSQQQRDTYWYNELKKVEDLLTEAYGVNLIPLPYRYNLAAIQYIYEYMSSAPVSLEHTLLSTQIEAGIQRIEKMLDIIISQQQEMIFQLHRQEAQNQKMMEQNKKMLTSLHRVEVNTLEAAQYAQLSASYSKTCAFFALADYLDR